MKNDNLQILKLFARKLANCRYRVSPKVLIEYLNKGQFGYAFEDDKNQIVTNDFVFADDILTLVKHIREIFKQPHINLKQENIIQTADTATKFDSHTLNETVKNEKLWKVNSSGLKPEYVHAYVQEENLAIYENRFITFLIDVIYNAVTEKIGSLCANLKNLNNEMLASPLFNGQNSFTPDSYVQFSDSKNGMPVLVKQDDANVNVISSLVKSKKLLEALKNDPVYIACKKAGKFNGEQAKLTNIFENDVNYNYCYIFFMNYFNKDVTFSSYEQMYRNFVEINLLTALEKLGFELDENTENISVSNDANIKFNEITFNKAPFSITIKQADGNVLVEVLNVVDGNKSTNLLQILNTPYANNQFTNLTNVFVISDGTLSNFDCIVSPAKTNSIEALSVLIKKMTFIALGSQFVHTRYCPVCGSALVSPDGSDYTCISCNSLYHIFNYEYKDIVWVKTLPAIQLELPQAKSDLDNLSSEVLEEVKNVEDDVTDEENDFTKLNIVSKSFLEKMSLSTEENNNYYKELKEYILSYEKTRSNVSFAYDNFFYGRNSKVKISLRGKTLSMFVALNPLDYADSKYFPKDFSDVKKYVDTPMMVKVKSERGVKFAKELIDVVFEGIERRIIKEELTPPTAVIEETIISEIEKQPIKNEFISKSFFGKMCQTSKENKEYYNEIKNYILSFAKTRSNVSFAYDNFFFGRNSKIKLSLRGKTLSMFIALNPLDFADSKYFPKDFSDIKKYEDTPMMVKIKSPRGVKFAKELIDIVFEGIEGKKDFVPEKYSFPYKSNRQLINLQLAKITTR